MKQQPTFFESCYFPGTLHSQGKHNIVSFILLIKLAVLFKNYAIQKVPEPGIESEPQLWPTLWQRWILLTYCAGQGDQTHASAATQATVVRFLTHCATAGPPIAILITCLWANYGCHFVLDHWSSRLFVNPVAQKEKLLTTLMSSTRYQISAPVSGEQGMVKI